MYPVISTDTKRVALHLADRALSPIFLSADIDTTAQSGGTNFGLTQASALSSLTSVALTAYDASLRFGAGMPLSIMIETKSSGPILLSSYLNPYDIYKQVDHKKDQLSKVSKIEDKTSESLSKSQSTGSSNKLKDLNMTDKETINRPINKYDVETDNIPPLLPPLLIASAVCRSSTDAAEANNGIKKLIKAGRECQKAWIKEHDEANTSNISVGMV
ncbi:hypothetical protein OnM2_103001 [Erysiphe neolycopersici]|uniref:Uncharacterized protein n=1 Tax=Erysiphe neolycopersici TaxID=212602 RepID=A0A420H863_9PEZI|nr:hypothetical protein OnM2_103001 [Erysiphe neolycopersici]